MLTLPCVCSMAERLHGTTFAILPASWAQPVLSSFALLLELLTMPVLSLALLLGLSTQPVLALSIAILLGLPTRVSSGSIFSSGLRLSVGYSNLMRTEKMTLRCTSSCILVQVGG